MEGDEDMFNSFNDFIFLAHSEDGVDVNVNVLRKYIINRFHKAVPPSRILITLSLIDDIFLKLHNENLEKLQDDMYSVHENVLYMLSFEKIEEKNPVGEDNDVDNDDGESEEM